MDLSFDKDLQLKKVICSKEVLQLGKQTNYQKVGTVKNRTNTVANVISNNSGLFDLLQNRKRIKRYRDYD